MAWSAAISWIVLRPLIASMATLALNSGLWVRRLLNSCGEGCAYGGSPFQGRCPASEVNDGGCPEKPDHLSPRLGRPKSDQDLVAEENRQFIDDQRRRNAVKGKFGQGKRRNGLGLIHEKLPLTQGSTIAMNFLVMNFEKLLELLLCFSHAGFIFSGPEDRSIMPTLTSSSHME
jgi:hypothetical protein